MGKGLVIHNKKACGNGGGFGNSQQKPVAMGEGLVIHNKSLIESKITLQNYTMSLTLIKLFFVQIIPLNILLHKTFHL